MSKFSKWARNLGSMLSMHTSTSPPLDISHGNLKKISKAVDILYQIFPNLLLGAMQIDKGNLFFNMEIFAVEALYHILLSDRPSRQHRIPSVCPIYQGF